MASALTLTALLYTFSFSIAQEGGYADRFSVAQGDTIRFAISTLLPTFDIAIFRYEESLTLVSTIRGVAGGVRAVPDSAYHYGCRWPVSATLAIPPTWGSGVYRAEFGTSNGKDNIVFIVRARAPGVYSRTVVSVPMTTWEAYNAFGGKSLYDFNSSSDTAAVIVSCNRPFRNPVENKSDQSFDRWGAKLVAWLAHEKIPVEFIANTDLDDEPSLLSKYALLCIVGHDEYWTRDQRSQAEGFLAAGKRIIILGGNTCWWQVRYDHSARTITCYRDYLKDPFWNSKNRLVTVNWYDTPVNDPENPLTGLSWRNGGLVNTDSFLLKRDGFGAYHVWNAHHWLYAGTGMDDGMSFGFDSAIVGYEVDGTQIDWNNGFPTTTGRDDTPLSFQILGISPARVPASRPGEKHAVMGLFTTQNGGAVFNAGTTNWTGGLAHDTVVQRITKNVFARFHSGAFPPTIRSWIPSRMKRDTVAGEAFRFNSRIVEMHPGDSLYFSVTASDPGTEAISYAWDVNGVDVARAPGFWWSAHSDASRIPAAMRVRVRNSHGVTEMNWVVRVR